PFAVMGAVAMLVRRSMFVVQRRRDTLEVTPVVPEAAPKAVVVDIPFRASRQSSAISECCGSGGEADNDSGQNGCRLAKHAQERPPLPRITFSWSPREEAGRRQRASGLTEKPRHRGGA